MSVPIICLGCNERAEIPFIPPDLTCVACKTGAHIDLDDGTEHTAGVIQDPTLPMAQLPTGTPEQDQDMDLLRESEQPRKVVVPKGSAPYSQRALAVNAAFEKVADFQGVQADLTRANGQRVVISYTTDLGMRDDAGTLTYDGTLATLATSHGTLTLRPSMVLSVTAAPGDWADQRTEPVAGSPINWQSTFPSGATAVRKHAKVCPDCNGSKSVPAGGGEDPDDVDNGYVQCPTCKGTGEVADDYDEDDEHTAAKVAQIAEGVLATNPSMRRIEAVKIAAETVKRYPNVVKTAMPSPAEHGVDVGAVFVSSWGYDQTNIDFYVVTEVLPGSVRVRQCGQFVEHKGSGSDSVTPDVAKYLSEPQLKRLQVMNISGQDEPYININSYSNARLWDGSPKYQTASGWGH